MEEWGWLKKALAQPLPQPKVVWDKAFENKLEVFVGKLYCLLTIKKLLYMRTKVSKVISRA